MTPEQIAHKLTDDALESLEKRVSKVSAPNTTHSTYAIYSVIDIGIGKQRKFAYFFN